MNKKELRAAIREKKRAMTPEEIEERSRHLGEKFAQSRAYREADRVTFPPLSPVMLREETVELWEAGRWRTAELRYILTWVDVPDSRGTLRRHFAIVVDGRDQPQFAMKRAEGLLGKKDCRWLRLPEVR